MFTFSFMTELLSNLKFIYAMNEKNSSPVARFNFISLWGNVSLNERPIAVSVDGVVVLRNALADDATEHLQDLEYLHDKIKLDAVYIYDGHDFFIAKPLAVQAREVGVNVICEAPGAGLKGLYDFATVPIPSDSGKKRTLDFLKAVALDMGGTDEFKNIQVIKEIENSIATIIPNFSSVKERYEYNL